MIDLSLENWRNRFQVPEREIKEWKECLSMQCITYQTMETTEARDDSDLDGFLKYFCM